MYEIGDYVILKDTYKGVPILVKSKITNAWPKRVNHKYRVKDEWILCNKNVNIAIDNGIEAKEEDILKKVSKNYTKEDAINEFPEYFI